MLSAETSPVTQISKWVRWKSDVNEFTCEIGKKKPSSDEGEDKAKGFYCAGLVSGQEGTNLPPLPPAGAVLISSLQI